MPSHPAYPPHALPVRRSSALPAASFRSHLAVDTLAVRLAVPLIGPAKVFHLLGLRPAGRTKKKSPADNPAGLHCAEKTALKIYLLTTVKVALLVIPP